MNAQLATRIANRVLYEQIAPNINIPKTTTKTNVQVGKSANKAKIIAQQIYNAKGIVVDDEQAVVNAIKLISNKQQFDAVQKELMKLTNGRGIGQYVSGFIQDGIKQARFSLPYVNAIITHLKKINANPKTIALFTPIQQQLKKDQAADSQMDKAVGGPGLRKFWEEYHHEILMVAEIGAYFIPVVGPLISLGIASADATMYWNEGDRYTAGFIAVLTAIPLIGSLLNKIPGVKELGGRGIARLARALAEMKGGAKPILSKTEQAIVKNLGEHSKEVYQAFKEWSKKQVASKGAKVAGRVTSNVAKGATAVAVANYAVKPTWDKIYTAAGFDILDIESETDPLWQKLKKQAQQG